MQIWEPRVGGEGRSRNKFKNKAKKPDSESLNQKGQGSSGPGKEGSWRRGGGGSPLPKYESPGLCGDPPCEEDAFGSDTNNVRRS